jgi:DNA-binding NarL/FixJ family response regulator
MVRFAPNASDYIPCPATKRKTKTAKPSAKSPAKKGSLKSNGRKIGAYLNERDERGWMIPAEGTKRRQIYECLVAGLSVKQISEKLSLNANTLHQDVYRIRNPEKFLKQVRQQRSKSKSDQGQASAV